MARLLRILLLPLMAALMMTPPIGVAQESGNGTGESTTVTVGAPLPLTGRLADFGIMMKNSMDMAAAVINDAGGIRGRPLRVAYADDQSSPERAQAVVTELVDGERAVMLVGGYQSNATYAMADYANARDIPFLVSTAATDRITQQRWRNIYRLNPPVSEYTTSLEDFLLKELHPSTMAIVYEDSMFGTDGAANMMSFLQDNGIEVRDLIAYSADRAGHAYFRSLLAPLTHGTPDVIHMISYLADGVTLVNTIRDLDIPSQLTGGAGGFTHPRFLQKAGAAAEGLLVATLWSDALPYPGARTYHERYLSAHGTAPDYHGAEAYSALLVAADALGRAKSFRPGDIRAALDETFMMTPFGPVKFYSYEAFERQNSIRPQVLQVQSARFEVVWPPDLATGRLVRTPLTPQRTGVSK